MPVLPTLLCVDDEQNVLDVLSRTFNKLGEVITVRSGEEALEIIRNRRVDVLVTDQKMPGMSGIELARQARDEGFQLTTILLTAYTNPADLIAAINQGQVFRYVTKPFDLQDLTITVRNALDLVALRHEKDRLTASLHKRMEALNVLYEVSKQAPGEATSLTAIVDRLLSAVGRVLPHEASAVLLESDDSRAASLRIRCNAVLSDQALLHVKDSVLNGHRKSAGVVLPEDRVITNVSGQTPNAKDGLPGFACAISVPLVAGGRTVGTLALFSTQPQAYGTEDGELLDLLINQTTDALAHVRATERESRQRIEQMVEAMSDGVVLTDERGQVLVCNAAARTMLRANAGDEEVTLSRLTTWLGVSPFEIVRGWEYSGQKTWREELTLFERHVQLIVSPVTGPGPLLKGVLVVARDVTDAKQLAQRKDEFVGIVSHELRTPLTSITGALDLVLNHITGDLNEKQKRFLEMARESTDKLNALVDDLLDLAKLEKGRMRMAFELAHLDELARGAAEQYGPAMGERGLTVSLDVPPEGVRLLADPSRVTQVLNNLLTNAVKFTPPGGSVRVTVGSSTAAPGYAVLSVWNSGAPIPEANLERIFDRFEQARTDANRGVPGTGLGLSICRSILHAHGGFIWAEPDNTGARFVAVFPEEPPAVVTEHHRPPQRGTVLVVEDEFRLAWLMKAVLLEAGFLPVLANTGDDALTLARKHRPAVITLDQGLPDLQGLQLLDILQHDPDTKDAKVLVLSGKDLREEALAAGAGGFMQKPFTAASLVASVSAVADLQKGGRGRVLVVDDDAQIAAICTEVLTNQGFEVDRAGTVGEAKQALHRARPDLLLLDVSLPDGDGFSFFEAIKADRASAPLPVIFISARSDTGAKVRALKLGGDDYLTKPFDALELGARVESVLRRRSAEAQSSPTTQLPGSAAIEREVQRRIATATPFAFCYLDLDNLKAFNDYYGFAKADGVVKQTADLLREVVSQHGDGSEFVGHVAGDDFVFIASLERVDELCRRMVESFDRVIPLYYDRADRERGYIQGEDRFGQQRRFSVMSVSIVAVLSDGHTPHPELARMAAELKKKAKAVSGSVYLRSDGADATRSTA